MSKKDAAIHKRQQIEQSSRVMFLWVAGASVIVGFALVISWFLVQQIIFKERVLGEKNNTAAVLKNNNDAVEKLRGELKVLETNSHLNASRINNDEKALQVVLSQRRIMLWRWVRRSSPRWSMAWQACHSIRLILTKRTTASHQIALVQPLAMATCSPSTSLWRYRPVTPMLCASFCSALSAPSA